MEPVAQEQAEDDWLLAFAAGDQRAAMHLAQALLPRVLAQARRMLGNEAEAEDVAQEAMLRLWRIAPDWQPGTARVSTWLYRVVANLCLDRLRRRHRTTPLEPGDEPESGAPTVAEALQERARMDALRAALADLPERQAQAVALRHLEDLSNPEIAEVMGESVRTVESLIARGKKGLIARLSGRKQELGFEDD